ncbi:MAG: cutinase family protein [Kineosporiaceae bacterium]|nr:cutinase family protein [Kineosporiaceae bacterium]MBK7624440.1 cutinase family protein [Kineosporiaceae bacterium]MBK8077804.1 cutinase family protein [Kineosporiaceae bacterium]
MTAPAQALAKDCRQVLLFGARGSGQKANDHRGLGTQVANVLDRVSTALAGRRTTTEKALDYDPNNVAVLAKPLGIGLYQYMANLGFGVDLAYSELTLRKITCPSERIVLAGFSQGAMVMHRVVQRLAAKGQSAILARIDGVILLADGDHIPHDNVNIYGTASAAARGIGIVNRGVSRSSTTPFPSWGRSRVHSVCSARDVVCDHLASVATGLIPGIATHVGAAYLGAHANITQPVGAVVRTLIASSASGSAPAAPKPQPAPATAHSEQSGSLGSPTFLNPTNAAGAGPRVAAMSTVQVSCRVYAPAIASANPDGWWYRIASFPWSNQYYAVANTFWNGDIPGRLPYTHNTDFGVPVC